MQMDQATTAYVSARGYSIAGSSHSREVECTGRCPVTSNSNVRDRVVLTSVGVPGHHTGMGNTHTGSVCHEMGPQASPVCVTHPRSFSHGSRCSVNELKAMWAYAYPPPALLPQILQKVQWDQCKLILIAPCKRSDFHPV